MSNKKVLESLVKLTEEFASKISELYGGRLNKDKVILYGSYARGDQRDDSDVDYLIVLNDEEIKTLREISFISLLGLKYGVWVSAIPFFISKLCFGETPLAYNIKNEGIVL